MEGTGPYEGSVDVAVQFDGSGSHDPDGNIKSYKWDVGFVRLTPTRLQL
jgi:hypothetical protein